MTDDQVSASQDGDVNSIQCNDLSKAAAISYLSRGFAPIPVPKKTKGPKDRTGWENERHTAESIQRWSPYCNVGLLLGEPSNDLVDVDLDVPEAVRIAPMFLPPTDMVSGRPSNPRSHHWYRTKLETKKYTDVADEISKLAGKGMLLEVRSTGGQTLVPPSIHPSGEMYTGAEGYPAEVDAEDLFVAVGSIAACCCLARRWPAVGARHEAHLALAGMLLTGGIDSARTKQIVEAVCILTGADDIDQHLACVDSTAEKIAAGENVTGGTALVELLRGDGSKAIKRVRSWLGLTAVRSKRKRQTSEGAVDSDCSDEDLALEFTAEQGDSIKFCKQFEGWLVSEGHVYRQDYKRQVYTRARKLIRGVKAEIGDQKERQRIGSSRTVNAVVSLCSADERHATSAHEWDVDPFALNTPDGVVDLRTGKLRPHEGDLMMKSTPIAPADKADESTCPLWLKFIRETTEEMEDFAKYLQRRDGYCATGVVREHALFADYSLGGSGKGVHIDTINHVLGDYATKLRIETLLETNAPGHATFIVDLFGRRLAYAEEPSTGATWNAGRLKELTGGGKIKGNRMRCDPVEWEQSHKLAVIFNNAPKFPRVDDGIKRRMQLIPFLHKASEVDTKLREKLRPEAPGILRWVIDGAVDWYEHGLGTCEIVQLATEEYLGSIGDPYQTWVESAIIVDPDRRAKKPACWDSFRAHLKKTKANDYWSKLDLYTRIRGQFGPEMKSGEEYFQGFSLKPWSVEQETVVAA